MLSLELDRRRMMLEVRSNEAKAGDTRRRRKRTSLVNSGRFVAAQQIQHSVERPQRDRAPDVDQFLRELSAAGSGAGDACGELFNFDRRLLRPIGIMRSPHALVQRDEVLSQALVGFQINNSQP